MPSRSSLPRRVTAPVIAFALAALVVPSAAMPAAAIVPSCSVVREGFAPYGDLQTAVTAASPGETIIVDGICVGDTQIDKDLTISGATAMGALGTVATPVPDTLTGTGTYSTIRILGSADVTMSDLVITGGIGVPVGLYRYGGNIYIDDSSSLHLTNVKVTNGTADTGAGIYAYDASIRLDGKTVISGGTASFWGGGVFLSDATLAVTGKAVVRSNTASTRGGIAIVGASTLTLTGRSVVRGNSTSSNDAEGGGGISVTSGGTARLRGHALVTGNTADAGGGILIQDGSTARITGSAAVRGNTAYGSTADGPGQTYRQGGGGLWSDGTGSLTIGGKASIDGNDAAVAGAGGGIQAGAMPIVVGTRTVGCSSRALRAHVHDNTPKDCVR
jgi:hypothetical protein